MCDREIVSLVRKFVLIIIVDFASANVFAQVTSCLIVLTLFNIVEVINEPYKYNHLNRLSFAWLCLCIFVCYTALAVMGGSLETSDLYVLSITVILALVGSMGFTLFVYLKERKQNKVIQTFLSKQEAHAAGQLKYGRAKDERKLWVELFPRSHASLSPHLIGMDVREMTRLWMMNLQIHRVQLFTCASF